MKKIGEIRELIARIPARVRLLTSNSGISGGFSMFHFAKKIISVFPLVSAAKGHFCFSFHLSVVQKFSFWCVFTYPYCKSFSCDSTWTCCKRGFLCLHFFGLYHFILDNNCSNMIGNGVVEFVFFMVLIQTFASSI